MKNGFTIAEIVVVMAIVAVVGTFLLTIFSSTLRGSNKSQMISAIKQNGQAVLEEMDRDIRAADNIICKSNDGLTLVIFRSKTYTRFRFIAATATSNGTIAQDNPVASSDIQLFLNNVCTDPLLPTAMILTDNNSQSGVSVESGIFLRDPNYQNQVTIIFTLKPPVGIPPAIIQSIEPVAFQTTVECRNCP